MPAVVHNLRVAYRAKRIRSRVHNEYVSLQNSVRGYHHFFINTGAYGMHISTGEGFIIAHNLSRMSSKFVLEFEKELPQP